MKVLRVFGAALVVACAAVACSDPVATPTAASSTSPFAVNINGLYGGTMVLSNVVGGECVGADLARSVGSVDLSTVTITQKQSDVTAVVRSATTGLRCSYSGSARSAVFAVDTTACNSEIIYQCSTGESRVLVPVGSTITASVFGDTSSGTVATTFNVYREDSSGKRIPVAGLVTQHRFDAVRQ